MSHILKVFQELARQPRRAARSVCLIHEYSETEG